MYILGLGGSNHDYSSCLVKDGEIICMIEDERITRKKNGKGLGVNLAQGFSRNYCLDYAGITMTDIDLVVANNILNKTMYRKLEKEVYLLDHHLSHAASSYFLSDFEEAAILVVDAVGSKSAETGEYQTISYGIGEGKDLKLLQSVTGKNISNTDYVENSLGIFYSIITEIVGFGEHQEGKTMGLAPYGTDKYYSFIKKYITYKGNGVVGMTQKNIEELGCLKDKLEDMPNEKDRFNAKADIAWAAQTILEEILIKLCRYVKKITKKNKLCLAGGIALNSVANYKIHKQKIFSQIFIPAACGDSGTSIGSALYGYYCLEGKK